MQSLYIIESGIYTFIKLLSGIVIRLGLKLIAEDG